MLQTELAINTVSHSLTAHALSLGAATAPLHWSACRDHRFRLEATNEWYCDLGELEPLLRQHMPPAAEGAGARRVLLPGCGNSELGPQMAAAGFGHVTCVDYVAGVIDKMQELYGCAN